MTATARGAGNITKRRRERRRVLSGWSRVCVCFVHDFESNVDSADFTI